MDPNFYSDELSFFSNERSHKRIGAIEFELRQTYTYYEQNRDCESEKSSNKSAEPLVDSMQAGETSVLPLDPGSWRVFSDHHEDEIDLYSTTADSLEGEHIPGVESNRYQSNPTEESDSSSRSIENQQAQVREFDNSRLSSHMLHDIGSKLTELFEQNIINTYEMNSDPKWRTVLNLALGFTPTNNAQHTPEFCVRRDDQLIKKVMTIIKDSIYKPIKDQMRIVESRGFRKRTKAEALDQLKLTYNLNVGIFSSFFGSKLRDGLTNGMIDHLFSPDGKTYFDEITNLRFVCKIIEALNEQTRKDIRTNIIEKLRCPLQTTALLAEKSQRTKLPTSFLCNLVACLCFYQRVLCRGLDYSAAKQSNLEALHVLKSVSSFLISKIKATPAGKQYLSSIASPDELGRIKLKKAVMIPFLLENSSSD
jgi:hypothetical protein